MSASPPFVRGSDPPTSWPRHGQLYRSTLRVFATVVLTFGWAALGSAQGPDAAGIEFFEKHVRPLLVSHCYECHAGGEMQGGLSLESRDGIARGGDSGAVLVPGDPEQSRLVQAVRYSNPDLQMPPIGRLSDEQIATIEKWVRLGAPDPREESTSADDQLVVGLSVEEGRDFWSFRPIGGPPVPPVDRQEWVRTPIDAFVLAQLEANGLTPAPPADKRTLIRRATFDLIGLPPTPEEVDAFVRDKSPHSFQRLVDRLLSSPGYGVRWGRHWLDVARYADSNGLDENLAFGNAWRYRDYVVDAFNRDKPFDRFLIEQIAGDLLPDANEETKTATGFLALGAKVLAEPDREKLAMDTIDEQLDALGKAFLGMTLGCARCHDHKFDPLTQRDYYALAAVFKSTKTFGDTNYGAIKHWYEHSFATPAELAELEPIERRIADAQAAAASFRSTAMDKLRAAARARATDYLLAAAKFEPGAPFAQIDSLACEYGLHARILHHCRLHLEYHRDDPFFVPWHTFRRQADLEGIERHYRPLFAETDAALAASAAANSGARTLDDPRLEAARKALDDPAGFLAVPAKPEFAFDAATLAEYHRLAEEARLVESRAPDAPGAMGVADGEIVKKLAIHIRGSHRNLGELVARDVPAVMRALDAPATWPEQQSGRRELAEWMAGEQHPLTARVYANRVWRWHFGEGLVTTTENFGRQGDAPSHPELLDWLARYLIENGWSTKALHRLILSSNSYQMASRHPDEADAIARDPDNRLLWKFRLLRLDAEQIRDAILAVSERLDESLNGKTIPLRNRQFVFDHTSIDHTRYDSLRRAIYLPVIRNNVYSLFQQFDFPDPTMPTGDRAVTTVAPQALLMMNSELVMDSADALARRLIGEAGDDFCRVQSAYLRVVGRPASDAEAQRAVEMLREFETLSGSDEATKLDDRLLAASEADGSCGPCASLQAWSVFCQALFLSNEFLYVR